MIRIDEIYSNIFAARIQSQSGRCAHFFDPFGTTAFDNLCQVPYVEDIEKNFLFWDQEPIHPDVHRQTFEQFKKTFRSKQTVLVTSERDSEFVDWACETYSMTSSYYFFHGWACLDWYRGYDIVGSLSRTPFDQRNIDHAVFMPNRIIGGKRPHRLGLLSRFHSEFIRNNSISVPDVCPYENIDVRTLCDNLNLNTKWLDCLTLPRHLPGEETLAFPNSSFYLDMNHGINSLLYLVTETVFEGRRHHLTEKTFKPICLGMPFILAAPCGSLEYLRSYGFKTFDRFWDESYDVVEDPGQRLDKIAKIVQILDSMTVGEAKTLQKYIAPVVEHNLHWFYNGGFEDVLKRELWSMLDSW